MEAPGRVFPLLVARGSDLYLVGGVDAAGKHFGDVWRWSSQWERLATAAIPVRSGHVGFLFEDSIYVYGGQEEAVPSHIYDKWLRLNLSSLQWQDFAGPSGLRARHSSSCVLDLLGAKAYVYGGASGSEIESDTLMLDLKAGSWTSMATTHKPPGRMMHAAVLHQQQMYVFGGIDAVQKVSSDLFCLNIGNGTWRSLGMFVVEDALMKMCGLAMVATEDSLVLFGGMDLENLTVYNQVFIYEIRDAHWYRVPEQRTPRFGCCMVLQSGDITLLGGCDMRTRATATAVDTLSVVQLQALREAL